MTKGYSAKNGGCLIKYYLEDNYFYRAWEDGIDVGSESFPLEKLSVKFSKTVARSENTTDNLNFSIVSLLGSVIIYFSDYHVRIPLLAPALLLFGIVGLYLARDQLFPRTWTAIRYESGEIASYILHGKKNDSDRVSFEKNLIQAIEHAKGNVT